MRDTYHYTSKILTTILHKQKDIRNRQYSPRGKTVESFPYINECNK